MNPVMVLSGLGVGHRPDGSCASALQRPTDGSFCCGQCVGDRRLKQGGLMLDHDTRKPAQHDLDAAHEVDAAARAVDIAHPDGDTLDGARILPELFAESPPDVRTVVCVEADAVDSDVGGRRRCRRPTRRPLHGLGNVVREWLSLARVSCARAFARFATRATGPSARCPAHVSCLPGAAIARRCSGGHVAIVPIRDRADQCGSVPVPVAVPNVNHALDPPGRGVGRT